LPYGLYLILDPSAAGRRSLVELVEIALAAGVRAFQLRMKAVGTRQLYDLAARLCPLVQGHGGRFIVNDRCDVALAVGADGVHLGQDDLLLPDARQILGHEALIGISTHTLTQALDAERGGADYIGFGPIFPTVSKGEREPIVGLEGLRAVRRHVQIPIVAIGGIGPGNVADVVEAGSNTPAMISAILSAPDPAVAIADTLAAIRGMR